MGDFIVTGSELLSIDGLEIWNAEINLQNPTNNCFYNSLSDSLIIETLSAPGISYRPQKNPDLTGEWTADDDWREGSGDYLLWEYPRTLNRNFWRIESTAPTEP